MTETSQDRTIIGAAATTSMLAPLNSTMIVVALPGLLHDFHHSLAWGTWIVTSYLVAMATVQPLAGSLGDLLGRKRMMTIGLAGFMAASTAAFFAWRIEFLLLARTTQAVCGALAIPNGAALVRQHLPASRQGRVSGVIGSAVSIAAGIGPTLGGVITGAGGWRWIFAANVLLIAPALALLARVREERRPAQRRRFDLTGAALLIVGLVSLVLSLTLVRVPSMPHAVSGALGVLALLTAFLLVRHLRRADHPLVDPALFRAPGYTPAVFAVLLTNMAMYTVLLSLPIFLEQNAGWSTSRTGLLLSGLSLQTVLFSPVGGRLADRSGPRVPATVGAALMLAGVAPLLMIGAGWSWGAYLGTVALIGIGSGLVSPAIQASAVLAVHPSAAGQAVGFFSTMRYLGSTAGATIMGAVLVGEHPNAAHYQLLYATLLVAAAAGILVCRLLPRPCEEFEVVPAGTAGS